MEPQIRYVQSADGTRIATSSLGEGRPLVYHPIWFNTIELLWRIPKALGNLERLAQKRKVVLYDSRGTGLSSRDAVDFSLDARVADLEAVAESLDADRVDLFSGGRPAAVAIVFAARRPEKVSKLALWSTMARGADYRVTDNRLLLLEPLAAVDWEFYIQCRALVLFGWNDVGRLLADLQAGEVSREVHMKHMKAASRDDLTALLPLVRCPTLVMIRRGGQRLETSSSQEVTAAIPGARMVTFQQDQLMFLGGDWDSSLRIVAEFLDEDAPPPSEEQLPSGTAIILFADIADSTALTERLGDAAFRDKARELDEALRRAIASNGGTAIDGKLLGDGVLATFGAAREAIACAQEIHRIARSQSSPPRVGEGLGEGSGPGPDPGPLTPDPLLLHVGIHAGDIIRESNNVYGGAVNIAARVASEAAAGETLVSATVRDLARTSAGVSFEDRGERELKGVGEPVRVFAVRSDPPLPFREGAGG